MPVVMMDLRTLLAREEAPLAGGRPAAAPVWRLTCLLAAALLTLAPPATAAGCAAAAGVLAAGLAWPPALWAGYPAVAQLGILAWAAGAGGARADGELLA